MDIFIRAPWLAFAVGAIFFAIKGSARSRAVITTAVVWFFYGVYEYLMHFRVLCSGECNIRVDLLLIYPVLLILSIVAIVASFKRSQR
jgi:hypothetical protein